MTVIEARAETLADVLSGTQATYAETILDWSRDIVELTQKVRRVLSTMSDDGLTEAEAMALGPEYRPQNARRFSRKGSVEPSRRGLGSDSTSCR